MKRYNNLTLKNFIAVTAAIIMMSESALADVSVPALAPLSLNEAIQRLAPDSTTGTGLLSLDSADIEQYIPNLRSQLRHAEGAAIPLNNSIGLDATTVSLELRQPLYRSGQGRAQTQMTDSRLRAGLAAKLDEDRARNLLIVNTYLDALRLDEQRQLGHGLNTANYRLESKYKDIRRSLQKRAGIHPATPLAAVAEPDTLPVSLQRALTIAEDTHPAIARAHYECAAAEASSRSVRWEDAPDIDLRGGLDRTTETYADTGSEESGIIGLRATIPLRGDSERKSRRLQTREDAASGRLKIDTTRLAVRQQVIVAWDGVTQARAEERFQTRKAQLAQAAAEGRLPAESRLSAMGNNDAFAKLARQARLDAIDARYATLKAEYALLAATGQLNQTLARPQATALARQDSVINLQNDTESADISIK